MSNLKLIVLVTPDRLSQVQRLPVTPAHLAYRMGRGPHLFRTGSSVSLRGGYLVVDCRGFDGMGRADPFCQEVVRECSARGFTGIICDFEGGRLPPLEQIVRTLGDQCQHRGWELLIPEPYGNCTPYGKVLLSSALSGGSLLQRLREGLERFGPDRVALGLERTAEDFFLPSPTGGGVALTQEELHARMERLQPSVFFSRELCARYFTYMSRDSGAHFVLFDDPDTLARKVSLAQSLGIHTVVGAWEELSDAVSLFPLRPAESGRAQTRILR